MRYYQSPVNDSWVNHKGHPKGDALDLGWFSSRPATKNQPIYAVDEGTVLFSGTTTDGGITVVVKHPWDSTYDMWVGYMHLSKRNATVGASVKQGQQIGNMGTTGNSNGEHLHVRMEKVKKGVPFSWANYSAGTKVNPLNYFYVYPHQYVEDMQKLPKDANKKDHADKTDEQLATEVWQGKHGNGDARKASLGTRYDAVQTLVEKGVGKPKPAPSKDHANKTDEQLAQEVWAGKHGDGDARKKSLGNRYDAVQALVEKGVGKPAPTPSPSSFKKGDRVQIKKSAKTYATGETIHDSWKEGSHTDTIVEVSGNKARLKEINSWIKLSDLKLTSSSAATSIKEGDMVLVRQGAKAYHGVGVTSAWYRTPKVVSEISGNRVVLDIEGWNTPFHINDLIKQ